MQIQSVQPLGSELDFFDNKIRFRGSPLQHSPVAPLDVTYCFRQDI